MWVCTCTWITQTVVEGEKELRREEKEREGGRVGGREARREEERKEGGREREGGKERECVVPRS